MDDPAEPRLIFGRVLRRIRRERDLSQDALAHVAHIASKHLSELERGRKEPRLGTLVQLADALGMTSSALLAVFDEERSRASAGVGRPSSARV